MKFKVGDRVRFVRATSELGRRYVGYQASVSAVGPGILGGWDGVFRPCDYWLFFEDGESLAVDGWQVEPILPAHDLQSLLTAEGLPDFSIPRPTPVYAHLRPAS